jgi:adenylate cyclase
VKQTQGLLAKATKIRKRERFIPIGLKLIAIITLLLVAALGSMTFLATSFFTREVERSAKLDTLERAELIAQKLEAQFGAIGDRAKLFASSLEGGISFGGTGAKLSSVFFEQDPDLLAVCVLRRAAGGKGYAIAEYAGNEDKPGAEAGKAASSGAWIESMKSRLDDAFSGSTATANVSRAMGSATIALALPFSMRRAGEAESVVVALESMDQVTSSLASRELYVNFLAGPDGDLVAHQDEGLALAGASMRASPIVRDSLSSTADPKQLGYEEGGKRYLGSYKKILSGALTVYSVVDERAALEAVYQIQRRNLLIVGIVLSAALILALLFSRTLTTPIKRLVEATDRIRDGDYAVSIPNRSRDELGRLTTAFQDMGEGLADREKLKTAFGKFVNKEIAERIMNDELSLGGETKEATIFFSDIRSFTAISEKLTPHEVVEFLNDYMTRMVACVNATRGVVDKYIGDAIMAVWGVPYAVGNDAQNAVEGALMMRAALREYNASRAGTKKPFIKIGCGINSGPVVAGQIGSMERMEYTVIGDAVNLASRIETLNKPFRTDILVSQGTYERVKGLFESVPMKKITVKGKAEPQQIYAILGRKGDPATPGDLDELREILGWEKGPIADIDADEHEEKFKIIE